MKKCFIGIGLPLFLLITYFNIVPAQEMNTSENNNDSLLQLQASIEQVILKNNIPGAAIAIVTPDSVKWIKTFGYADLEKKEPITTTTRFCIGSCTKSFTGLTLLALSDKGMINLNTPVKSIAPEIPIENPWEKTDPVRIIHLLEHTAGFEDSHLNWFYFNEPELSLQEAIIKKKHLLKVRWKPGTRFCYSSPGFTIAGYIIEKTSGVSYANVINTTLLQPIGMKDSVIGRPNKKAIGYGRNNIPVPPYYDYDVPAGALYTSIDDMAKFLQFLLQNGKVEDKQIISSAAMQKIGKPKSSLAALNGLENGYSYGVSTRYSYKNKWLGHSGAVPGFICEYYYNHENQIGLVVMQNSFDTEFSEEIFSLVWKYVGTEAQKPTPPEPLTLDPMQVQKYIGYYEPRNPKMKLVELGDIISGGLTITSQDNKIILQSFMSNPIEIFPLSTSTFRRKSDPEATLVFIDKGNDSMILATRNGYFEKISPLKPIVLRVFLYGSLILLLVTILFSFIWLPRFFLRKISRKDTRSLNVRFKIFPFLTALSLLLGVIPFMIFKPSMLELGMKTVSSITLYVATILFAFFSFSTPIFTILYRKKVSSIVERIFTFTTTFSNLILTLILLHWSIIGIQLWKY